MFTAEYFKRLLTATPFVPFRVTATDGRAFAVPNHDVATAKRHALEIGLDPDDNHISGDFIQCALLHISRVEELNGAKA